MTERRGECAAEKKSRSQWLWFRTAQRLWWWTSPIASVFHRWTRWTQEPNTCPRWLHRWPAGLNVACWTHVCGHSYLYSFRVGCIYWAPRYAKRALRLP